MLFERGGEYEKAAEDTEDAQDEEEGVEEIPEDGMHLLRCVLQGLGDSKLVEDIHQHLRDLARKTRHQKRSPLQRMIAVLQSGVLEGRGIPVTEVKDTEIAHAPSGLAPKPHTFHMSQHLKTVPKEWQALSIKTHHFFIFLCSSFVSVLSPVSLLFCLLSLSLSL